MKFTAFSLICALMFCGAAFGQVDVARVSGRVSDPNAAIIIGATVTAKNTGTGIATVVPTNDQGIYNFAALPPGNYQFSVSKQGFKVIVRPDVVLHVGDTVSMNFSMQVGAVQETVTVQGGAPLINTQDGAVGTVIERQIIANMPLNGRSFQGLITLSPGVATVTGAGQFVVDGQRTDMSYFTVDGVSANTGPPGSGNVIGTNGAGNGAAFATTGGTNSLASVDALQEFRITTSNFAPEFGRTPGGQISLVTRSGTNAFHGDVFDYLRNTDLDANDWFANSGHKPRGIVQQNDFGGVVGGPIKKDKLFFFGSYEGLRLTAPSATTIKVVPTQAARTLAAAAVNNGATGYMAQFLNAYHLPDGESASNPGPACTSVTTCVANYTSAFAGKSTINATSVRVDYNLNSKNTLFGRYSHAPSSNLSANSITNTTLAYGNDDITAGWGYVINNRMSNDARFNFTYTTGITGVVPINFAGSLSTIFPAGYAQPAAGFTLANIKVGMVGFNNITDQFLLEPNAGNSSQTQTNIVDTVSYIRGTHAFKFGADFRQLSPVANQVSFNSSYTFTVAASNPNCTVGAVSGLPPYICGNASAVNLQHLFPTYFRFNQYSFFGQDTWKVTQRLTVTYGLRWEINPAMEFENGRATFSIVPSSFNLNNMKNITVAPLGSPAYATRWGDISPRLGLAYQLSNDPKWGRVVRAGAGLFYDTGSNLFLASQGPFAGRVNNTTSPNIQAFVPFPLTVANSVFTTPPAPILAAPFNEGTDDLVNPNFNLPHVFQANLSVEQQLGNRQSLTISYVGSLGRDLSGTLVYPSALGNPAQLGNGTTTGDNLIIYGNFGSSSYHSLQGKFQRQFSNGLGAIASYTWAHSIDNSSSDGALTDYLPTAAQLTKGVPTTLAFGSSDFDIRQIFALSMVYDAPTPFAKNSVSRAILGHWSFDPIYHYQTAVPFDLTATTAATFQSLTLQSQRPNLITGIPIYVTGATCAAEYQAQDGFSACPGGIALNTALPNTPNGATSAQLTAAGCQANSTTTPAKGAFCTPNTVPVTVNGVTTQQAVSGNFGRNIVRGFALQEFDFSVHREFPIHESIRLHFEADMFNIFNHPQFGPAGNNISASTFGLTANMTNTAFGSGAASGSGFNPLYSIGGPRNFQFALKLFF